MPHIGVSDSSQHWFRWWLVAYSAPSHYLNQCWVIVNWTLRNKLQWNFSQKSKFIIQESAFENVGREVVAILSWGRWVINVCIAFSGDSLQFYYWTHSFRLFSWFSGDDIFSTNTIKGSLDKKLPCQLPICQPFGPSCPLGCDESSWADC